MKTNKLILLLFVALTFTFCNKNTEVDPNTGTTTNPTTPTGIGKGQAGVNGILSIDAWDKLATNEKNRIKDWNTIFMHQSVGGDLEDGANNNGFKFEYFDLNEKPKGLSGNVFSVSNGNPIGKMTEFKNNALAHKSIIKIAIFKFGYADITDANLEQVKTAYKTLIDDLRSQIPDLRFVHVTPPLIYIVSKDDGNAAKMKMAQWMKDTFKDKDNICDLQEIESDNGSCNLNGVWTICNKYRSTSTCPSKSQGVDAPEGQGHLCESAATRISKAFLYSIYQSGK
ncbi:hypothetical protein LV89_01915 [Arcicella aurantiaca]|uniref:GDSL-like lipase/acylhydrolase family protein n=1 Tax=Arcicella aurantiaca TaxID=591202 RepID=A0A316EAY2_9BACT|nr:hypothetical protein [Arcicella aurantiaca]PWK27101.1 hypothetical protein LV89_01915 [Arcicella aurantiaca]